MRAAGVTARARGWRLDAKCLAVARLVPGASCLTQALALQWLLARAGHGCELLVGVRRDDTGRFAAHAWVACNDRIVLGAAGTRIEDFSTLAGVR